MCVTVHGFLEENEKDVSKLVMFLESGLQTANYLGPNPLRSQDVTSLHWQNKDLYFRYCWLMKPISLSLSIYIH